MRAAVPELELAPAARFSAIPIRLLAGRFFVEDLHGGFSFL